MTDFVPSARIHLVPQMVLASHELYATMHDNINSRNRSLLLGYFKYIFERGISTPGQHGEAKRDDGIAIVAYTPATPNLAKHHELRYNVGCESSQDVYGDVQNMVAPIGLNQSELQTLVKTQTAFELVARPFKKGGETWWMMDVVLANGETVMLCKARRRKERKVWKQLSALQRFVISTVPEVEAFTVSNAPAKPDRKRVRHDKKTKAAGRGKRT